MCVFYGYVLINTGACRGQSCQCPGDGVRYNLCELHIMVLGSDLEFTVRAMYALHHRASTPDKSRLLKHGSCCSLDLP